MKPIKMTKALLRPACKSGSYDLWTDPSLAEKIGETEGVYSMIHIRGTSYYITLDPRYIPWSVLRAIEELGCTIENA